MRWSRLLLTTLRDDPQEAEIVSHKLMVRAGLIRKLSGGLYTFMPLGLRALHKVSRIVREEMDRAGAQEVLMPALQPAELWERSGRLATMGPGMFRLKDRAERLMALGPTHEEVVTELLAGEVSSYRQLPCTVYQIQTKFRDEIRPRFGLMRAKEFIMKDAYSFDTSLEAADVSYQAMFDAYVRIFRRCGLDARPVEADTGDIGGKWSHEFMVLADSGEDGIVDCPACGYAANQERAERADVPAADPECPPPAAVATPGARTIDDLTAFFGCTAERFIKTLIYLADGKPIAALVPGDRDLNEHKLKRLLNVKQLALADEATIEKVTGAPVGFAGPVGLAIPVYADRALRGAADRTTGANKADTHLTHVALARDAAVTAFDDLVVVGPNDTCPRCGKPMQLKRGIEVGHVFKLGTKYTESFQASYLTDKGQSELMVMGCYGIGVTRTLQAVIEQSHDADGIVWPISVAPYAVSLLLLDPKDPAVCAVVDALEQALAARGIDVFVDDREERPGVKFKDADLIGCPIRVVVGAKGLAKGGVEIKLRTSKEVAVVPAERAADAIAEQVAALTAALDT
ncbi:MAG: proline--tRNA ligase [Kiritimatiellae bacterium]|nr:proline--tRNA ligase [Kiritimatiellia bacterium]MDD4172611.1 proline--tRNA ligase [Kiritimatiellia bacterium]MDD4442163.1 proline--tRNA ligase [Kiritimatiellia bacterium]